MFIKTKKIILNAIPTILMIGLIPFVHSDYLLCFIDVCIIITALVVHCEKKDILILVFGLCILTVSEAFFVSTGVETFVRRSLFGLMPLWLPVLWGYAFVAIKRSIRIIEQ